MVCASENLCEQCAPKIQLDWQRIPATLAGRLFRQLCVRWQTRVAGCIARLGRRYAFQGRRVLRAETLFDTSAASEAAFGAAVIRVDNEPA